MQKTFLKNYAKNLTKEDIYNYINKNNINVKDDDVEVIYKHIKNNYNRLFDNPLYYIRMLKNQVCDETYYLILELFTKYKNFL